MKIRTTSIIFTLPLWLSLILLGCEASIDFPTHVEPKLSIIGQVAPVGWWEEQRIYVYTSTALSDSSDFLPPANLEVFLTANSDTTIQLSSESSDGKDYFVFPEGFIKSGNRYTIRASAPGLETVKASTIIPSPSTVTDLSIKTISIEPSELNDFKKNVRYTLQFKITHLPGNRYYHLVFYNEFIGLANAVLVDPKLSDNQPFIHHYAYGVLMDRNNLKDDQLLAFNFVDIVVEDHDLKKINVELRSVSAEYYKYHTSLARQLNSRDDIFGEPVTLFNNIQGGYGNFSGFARSLASSELPK